MLRWSAVCGLLVFLATGNVQSCPLEPGEAGIFVDDSCATSTETDFSEHRVLRLRVTARIPEDFSSVGFLLHWPASLANYYGGPLPGYDSDIIRGYAAECGATRDGAYLTIASYGGCFGAGTVLLSLGLPVPADTPRWQEITVELSEAPCSILSSQVELGYVTCDGEFVRFEIAEDKGQIVINPGGGPTSTDHPGFGYLKGIYR